jgi:hypothetical protein
VRELLLRDLGGFTYELHRTAGGMARESHRRLAEAKAKRLTALDAEVRDLEARLSEPHVEPVLREPGVGGTCHECGELYASDARYCFRCGTPLNAKARAEREAVIRAASEPSTTAHPTAEPKPASILWAAGPRPRTQPEPDETAKETSSPATSEWLAKPPAGAAAAAPVETAEDEPRGDDTQIDEPATTAGGDDERVEPGPTAGGDEARVEPDPSDDARIEEPDTGIGGDDARIEEPTATAGGDEGRVEPGPTAGGDEGPVDPSPTAGGDDARIEEPAATAGGDEGRVEPDAGIGGDEARVEEPEATTGGDETRVEEPASGGDDAAVDDRGAVSTDDAGDAAAGDETRGGAAGGEPRGDANGRPGEDVSRPVRFGEPGP